MDNVFRRRVQKAAEQAQARREALTKYQEDLFSEAFAREVERHTPIEVDYGIPAVRGWGYRDGKLTSLSVRRGDFWNGPVSEDDANPTRHNSRGFWAVRPNRLDIVLGYGPAAVKVVGWVELTGKVIEHEHGWRAETCIIRHLVLQRSREARFIKRRLEQLYQCDVDIAPFSCFREAINAHW